MQQNPQSPGGPPGRGNASPSGRSRRRLFVAASVLFTLLLAAGGYALFATQQTQKASQGRTMANTHTASASHTPMTTVTHAPTTMPTTFATPVTTGKGAVNWITVKTFTGNGAQKTGVFTAPKIWRIVWNCGISGQSNSSYGLIIHANTVTNTLLPYGVETVCSKNNTHSSVMMDEAGKVYLSIISQGNWSVQIQYAK